MSLSLVEAAVFSKPYFDRQGVIVAVDEGRVVGFAHAGFGPTADRSAIDMVMAQWYNQGCCAKDPHGVLFLGVDLTADFLQ